MITNFIVYFLYLSLNAVLLRFAILWGFDTDIGLRSGILLTLIISMYIVLHRKSQDSSNVSIK
jgi:hypothetical protein